MCRPRHRHRRLATSTQTVLIAGALTGMRHAEAGLALERELAGFGADALFVEADVRRADLALQVADLAAQRRLRAEPAMRGRLGQAAGFGNDDEIAKMPEFHFGLPAPLIVSYA